MNLIELAKKNKERKRIKRLQWSLRRIKNAPEILEHSRLLMTSLETLFRAASSSLMGYDDVLEAFIYFAGHKTKGNPDFTHERIKLIIENGRHYWPM